MMFCNFYTAWFLDPKFQLLLRLTFQFSSRIDFSRPTNQVACCLLDLYIWIKRSIFLFLKNFVLSLNLSQICSWTWYWKYFTHNSTGLVNAILVTVWSPFTRYKHICECKHFGRVSCTRQFWTRKCVNEFLFLLLLFFKELMA